MDAAELSIRGIFPSRSADACGARNGEATFAQGGNSMKRRRAKVLGASLIGFVALVTATAALLACRPAAAALAMVSCGEEHMSQFLIAPDRQRLDAVLAQFRQLCSQTVHGPVRIKVRCDTPGWAATSQGTNHRDYGYSLGHACGFATRAEAERAAKDECRKKPTESGCVIQEWSGCDDGTIFEPATNSGAHYSLKHFAQEHRGGAGGACIGSRPTGSAGAGGTRLATAAVQPISYEACRYFAPNGNRVQVPRNEVDAALRAGHIARKECFIRTCRVFDQSGKEMDFSTVPPERMAAEMSELRRKNVAARMECDPPN
ncbi:MAG: hypothetical protein IPM30_12085 [Burkholderiales bacterium]|jgi:hypothetical protein|nr:hypothetical protein [Burkholderiales bacterium]